MEHIGNLEQRVRQAISVLESKKAHEQKSDEALICLERDRANLTIRNEQLEEELSAVRVERQRWLLEKHDLDTELNRLRVDSKRVSAQLTQFKEEAKRLMEALTESVSAVEPFASDGSGNKRHCSTSDLTGSMTTNIDGRERNPTTAEECAPVERDSEAADAQESSNNNAVKARRIKDVARSSIPGDGSPADFLRILALIKEAQ